MSTSLVIKNKGIQILSTGTKEFKDEFIIHFGKYLEGFNEVYGENLKVDDFEFLIKDDRNKIIVAVKSNNPIVFETESKFKYEESLRLDFVSEYDY